MKVKLIDWETFERMIEKEAIMKKEGDYYRIFIEEKEWIVSEDMKKCFGGYIEVKEMTGLSPNASYTHLGANVYWHKSWFEK